MLLALVGLVVMPFVVAEIVREGGATGVGAVIIVLSVGLVSTVASLGLAFGGGPK